MSGIILGSLKCRLGALKDMEVCK